MKKKDFLWSLLAIVMAATLSVGIASCSNDDDDDGLGLSESQIRSYLESGSGVWVITEKGEGETFRMIFQDGKTTGFADLLGSASSYWLTPYSVKGDLVYIEDKVADEYHGDVLEGGIRITKLTASTIEFYWANDRSEKYTGTKRDDYK